MKNLLTTSFLAFNLLGGVIFAQTNTMPQTGNVGIGTLSPSSKLDVNGHVRIDSTLMVKDSILIQKDARILEDLKVEGQFYLPNISYANGLTNTEILVKDGNGQVLKSSFEELATIIYSKQCPSNPLDDVLNPVWVNGLNKIYIDCPPVNVGIGNSAPKVKLHVNGAIAGAKLSLGISDPENSTARFHLKIPGQANSSTVFIVENTQRTLFQINNDGIVRTREVMVNLDTPWPDYVFHSTYNLRPLKDVENFISKNGHLPNVPSSDTVEKEGLALGEMNKILLEKVEELTLYLIEQDKRIKALEAEMKAVTNN